MEPLYTHFEAWSEVPFGQRAAIHAIVAPPHRAASATLDQALAGWQGSWYWSDRDRGHLVLVPDGAGTGLRRWLVPLGLFLVTVVCALGAGTIIAGRWQPPFAMNLSGALRASFNFFVLAAQRPDDLRLGVWFAVPLLLILLAHEFGHYVAARRYALDASPPYFLPMPPTLSPMGSLGAFLRLRSGVLDRRQLLDVGAGGPIAGFVVALPILVWGYATSVGLQGGALPHADYVTFGGRPLRLGESLLTLGIRHLLFPGAGPIVLSQPAFAAWVGMFITGLNLLPLSQLDGGHVLYGVLGKRQAAVGGITVMALLVLAQWSPSWYLWVAISLAVGRGRWTHPEVLAPAWPVPPGRRWVAVVTTIIFALTFVPVPLRP